MKFLRLRRLLFVGLASLLVGVLVLEGLSSIALFVRDTPRRVREPLAERLHTEHDPELGWKHRASTAFSDLYRPGRSLSINAQGLRAPRLYEPRGAGEPRRALCVGDSFTLGYGVDDAHTWPAHFERELAGWEALNMGQGGYGLDQAWLWYRRDGAALEHEQVLFAFIADDFRRVRTPTFLGYSKPLVRWRDDRLELTRVPVPTADYKHPFLTQNLPLLAELRCVALGLRLLGRDGTSARADMLVVDQSEAERVAAGIFADLAARTRDTGRKLALVALPSLDPRDWNRLAAWPEGLRRACEDAAANGTPLIHLDGAFAALDAQARRELFLLDSELTAPGAKGHYSQRGNAFVAAAIATACARIGLLDPASPR